MKLKHTILPALLLSFVLFPQIVNAQDFGYEASTEKIHYLYPDAKSGADENNMVPVTPLNVIGAETAKVKIYIYGDLAETYTQKFFKETFNDLLTKYKDEVQFLYIPYPIEIFTKEKGKQAAYLTECLQPSNQFWPNIGNMVDNLDDLEDLDHLRDIDKKTVKKCLGEESTKTAVEEAANGARFVGFNAVPTFVIQGVEKPITNDTYAIKLSGAQDISIFEQAIAEAKGYDADKEEISKLKEELAKSKEDVSFLQMQINNLKKIIEYLQNLFHTPQESK